MGVLLPVPRTRDLPLGPPSASAEYFRRTFLQNNLQTSPPAPWVISGGGKILWNFFWSTFSPNRAILILFRFFPKFSRFSGQNRVKRGGPQIFSPIGILLYVLFGCPCKSLEPYDKPFWNIFENRPFSGQNRVGLFKNTYFWKLI